MIFCPNCENRLVPTEEKDESDVEKLFNLCEKCGYKNEYKNSIIHRKIYKGNTTNQTSSNINQYSRYDVSLPRTNKKTCPNPECISHKEKDKQEAVFIMDPISLKLTYVCIPCGTQWK